LESAVEAAQNAVLGERFMPISQGSSCRASVSCFDCSRKVSETR
jgi:hypothetical protein